MTECRICGDEFENSDEELCAGCNGPVEPEEGDWVTQDHKVFREQGGRGVHVVPPSETEGDGWIRSLKKHMDGEQFWPSVWFLSDHGNYHLLRLSDG